MYVNTDFVLLSLVILKKKCKMVSVFTLPDVNTWEVGRTLDKLETTPLRVVVSYACLTDYCVELHKFDYCRLDVLPSCTRW